MADACSPVLRTYATAMPGITLLAMAENHIRTNSMGLQCVSIRHFGIHIYNQTSLVQLERRQGRHHGCLHTTYRLSFLGGGGGAGSQSKYPPMQQRMLLFMSCHGHTMQKKCGTMRIAFVAHAPSWMRCKCSVTYAWDAHLFVLRRCRCDHTAAHLWLYGQQNSWARSQLRCSVPHPRAMSSSAQHRRSITSTESNLGK